jgi:hypothetical protein
VYKGFVMHIIHYQSELLQQWVQLKYASILSMWYKFALSFPKISLFL